MPRRVKRTPAEQEIAAAILLEQKRIDSEKRAAKNRRRFRVDPDKSKKLYGAGVGVLRARVGPIVLENALDIFGAQIVKRAAVALDRTLRETRRLRQKAIEKSRVVMRGRGMTEEQIARYRVPLARKIVVRKQQNVRHRWKGRNTTQWAQERLVKGKWKKTGVYFTSVAQVKRSDFAYKKRKARAAVATALGVSYRRASKLLREIEQKAMADLAKFRKTKAYEGRDNRWKAGITERRWMGASVAALYELLDVEFNT